jgi:hypothetical protein
VDQPLTAVVATCLNLVHGSLAYFLSFRIEPVFCRLFVCCGVRQEVVCVCSGRTICVLKAFSTALLLISVEAIFSYSKR